MSYYECEAGEHLAPLPRVGDENDSDNDSNSSDDSGVEVVSTYDADEYELIQLSTYLRVDSDADDGDDEEEDNEKENELSSTTLALYSHSDNSTDIIYSTAVADTTTRSGRNSLTKVKRKQWTIREKLKAISTFNDNDNKYQTCKIYGCTPNQLRQW